MTKPNEQELIEGCRQNDRAAQKRLYELYYDRMFVACRRYLKNPEDVAEALNKGFLSVFKNIGQYQHKGSFEGWIRKIMVNKALDHLKSTKTYRANTVNAPEGMEADSSVSNDAMSHFRMEELYAMIHQLPPVSRSVFNMYAIEGYNHKEIAEQLGMSEGTSRWHLNFARKQLRDAIEQQKMLEK